MKHYRKDERVQSLIIEINRWLYLGEDYSVDREKMKNLVSALGRVAEVLKENYFLQCEGSKRDRNTIGTESGAASKGSDQRKRILENFDPSNDPG